MLQLEVKQNVEAEQLKRAFCQVIIQIAKQIPDSPTKDQILAITPVLPHQKEVATTFISWINDEELFWAYTGVGKFYLGQGLYTEAEPWLDQCLAAVQVRLGEEHLDVATSLNNLAELYRSQGRYNEAEPLQRMSEK